MADDLSRNSREKEIQRMAEVYKEKGMERLFSIVEERTKRRKVLLDSVLLFKEALESSDTAKTKTALEKLNAFLNDKELPLYVESDEEQIALELSKFVDVVIEVKGGKKNINFCRGLFNPFLCSPVEAFTLSALSDGIYYKPITTFVLAVVAFLEDTRAFFPDNLKASIYHYIEKWMPGCIDIIGDNILALMSDSDERFERNDDPSGPIALGNLFACLIGEPRLSSVFDYAFERLKAGLKECMEYHSNPLDDAIKTSDTHAFDTLIELEGIEEGSLGRYPEESVYILEGLFEKGILLPGTDKAREAFFSLITNHNPSREILKRIVHPSYFIVGHPFALAAANRSFSVWNLDLLLSSEDDLKSGKSYDGMPALGYAVAHNDTARMKELYALGMDYDWHDERGNNILHYVIGKKHISRKEDIADALEMLSFLREEKNQYGSTPDDYLFKDENILEKYERITESEVYDKIFENGIDNSSNTLFISTYGFNHPFIKRGNVKTLIERSLRCTDDIVHMILNSEDLEEFRLVSSDSDRKFVGIIYDLDFFSPEETNTIYNLLSERNITLLIGIHFGLNAEPYDRFTRHVGNIVLGETAGPFNSEWIIARRGAEALGKEEYIFKHGDEYYVTKMGGSFFRDFSQSMN